MSKQDHYSSEKEEWRAFKGVVGKAFGSVKSLLSGDTSPGSTGIPPVNAESARDSRTLIEDAGSADVPSASRDAKHQLGNNSPEVKNYPEQNILVPSSLKKEEPLNEKLNSSTASALRTQSAQELRLQELEKMLEKFERRKARRQRRIDKRIEGQIVTKSLEEIKEELLKASFLTREKEEVEDIDEEPEEVALPQALGVKVQNDNYQLPLTTQLEESPEQIKDLEELEEKKKVVQDTLDNFRIDAQVDQAIQGPRISRIEIKVAKGVNVDSIAALHKNLTMELAAQSLRILAPIPGKQAVGVEIPNNSADKVCIRSILEGESFNDPKHAIPLALGKDAEGTDIILDLARAPHLLIAGATGSGKSVCINTIIMSLLYKFTPEDLRLILVDPKVVELTSYQSLPHLITPVITDTNKVLSTLKWVVHEMKHRYQVLAKVGARNIASFNNRDRSKDPQPDEGENPIPERYPFMVVIIDEMADIMMTAKGDVETSLAQIAQLSRAVGIHTIVATQRPSVNVITGIIKANYPTRIAFQVTSQVDSRTILDSKGAEMLLGQGDMLLIPPGSSFSIRGQGAFVRDEDIDYAVQCHSDQCDQDFDFDFEALLNHNVTSPEDQSASSEEEEIIQQAIKIIRRDQKASTSYIQRRLRIGYNKAASIIEALEERQLIGPQIGSSPREIFID